MRYLSLTTLLFLLLFTAKAQNTDSLFAVLKTAETEHKLEVYDQLCGAYYYINLDTVSILAKEKLALAQSVNNVEHIALSYKIWGNAYNYVGNMDSARAKYQKALSIAIENKLPKHIGTITSNIGTTYEFEGDFKQALIYYLEAMRADSIDNNIYGLVNSIPNIGNIYLKTGDYQLALNFFKRGLELAFQTDDYIGKVGAYNNLGLASNRISDFEKASEYYHAALELTQSNSDNYYTSFMLINLGSLYLSWENYSQALDYFSKAKVICEKTENIENLVEALCNLAIVYEALEKPDSAILYLDKALIRVKTYGMTYQQVTIYTNFGKVYTTKEEYVKARNYFLEALHVAQSLESSDDIAQTNYYLGNLEFIQKRYDLSLQYLSKAYQYVVEKQSKADVLLLLSKNYEALNQPAQALSYYRQYSQLHDSVFTAEKHEHVQNLSIRYETEKKEQQIKNLETRTHLQQVKNQKTRLVAILVISILISALLIILFLYRQRQLRAAAQMATTEQRYLRLQMNPHFIFNALSAIQHFVITQDGLTASSYLSRFAKLMRSILNSSKTEFLSLDKEIETLSDYLELQKLRLNNQLSYSIVVADDIDAAETQVPTMLAQPFIENAVEHGILKTENKTGTIEVNYSTSNKQLCVEITDDGVGRQQAAKNADKNHKSLATTITQQRLQILGNKFRAATVDIVDLYDADQPLGTKIIIRVPLISD